MSRRFEPDDTDRAILRLIQRDAALSLADIAKEVGLTPTPCWKRIRRMEQEGVITGRVVLLPYRAVGVTGALLPAFRPDSVKIDGAAEPMLLALSAQALTSDGAFAMVLPPKS